MIEELFKNIQNWGLSPLMIVFIVIWAISIYIFKDAFVEKIKAFKLNSTFNWLIRRKVERKVKELINHDIFNTCDRVKKEISFMKFFTSGTYDATKTKMCIDFSNFKVDVCKRRFNEFLDKDLDYISYDELKKVILDEMNAMHEEYINAIRDKWLKKKIKTDDVDYIVELFERFRYDVIVSFQHRIEAIFATEYYNSNFDKILACYDTFAMGIDLLPKDMLSTFEALNGKFKQIKYE